MSCVKCSSSPYLLVLSSWHRKAVVDNFFTLNETHPWLFKQLEVHFMSCATSKEAIGSMFKRCLRRREKFRTCIFPLEVSTVRCFMPCPKMFPYSSANIRNDIIAFVGTSQCRNYFNPGCAQASVLDNCQC